MLWACRWGRSIYVVFLHMYLKKKKHQSIYHFSLQQKQNVVQELKADCNLSRMCSSKLQPRGTQHQQQLYCGYCTCFKEFLRLFLKRCMPRVCDQGSTNQIRLRKKIMKNQFVKKQNTRAEWVRGFTGNLTSVTEGGIWLFHWLLIKAQTTLTQCS